MNIDKETGIITMMRGDSLVFPIKINIGTKLDPEYESLKESDALYFALMEPGQAFEDAVVKKKYTSEDKKDKDGNTLVVLNPSDTENLLVGKYYYTVKHRSFDFMNNEWVRTIIRPTLFIIEGNNPKQTETVYYKEGKYDIDSIVVEGGEISPDSDKDEIIFEGGEIV